MLGCPFQSPTINMFIRDDSFAKLVNNPKYYMGELEPFPIDDCFDDGYNKPYPLIGVGDIKLNCLDYNNCDEAIAAWNRGRHRVDYDNMLIIAASWDMSEDIHLITEISKVNLLKIIFTFDKVQIAGCRTIDYNFFYKNESGYIEPALTAYYRHGILRNFEKYVDIVKWINQSTTSKNCFNNIKRNLF